MLIGLSLIHPGLLSLQQVVFWHQIMTLIALFKYFRTEVSLLSPVAIVQGNIPLAALCCSQLQCRVLLIIIIIIIIRNLLIHLTRKFQTPGRIRKVIEVSPSDRACGGSRGDDFRCRPQQLVSTTDRRRRQCGHYRCTISLLQPTIMLCYFHVNVFTFSSPHPPPPCSIISTIKIRIGLLY
jgi:hypothetical protein